MQAIARALVCVAAVLLAGPCLAQTDAYPSRPVRVIVPFAAGGPTDVIARIVAQNLADSLHQQFYIENLPGSGGNTGTAAAAKAPPDGYTVLTMSTGFIVNPSLYAKVPYDPIRDFAPVTLAAASPNVLCVNPAVPAKTVSELAALIRANPGQYSYAQPSTGSTPHLSGELFKLRFGLDLVTVPFNGAALAINSTIAGHTPIAFTALPPAVSNVKDGRLRALAVTSPGRSPVLPEVPTMAEAGIADQEAETLTGFLVPAGTPAAVIARLNSEVVRSLALPEMRERLMALGFEPIGDTPAEFGARIKAEIAKWSVVVREAKLRIE